MKAETHIQNAWESYQAMMLPPGLGPKTIDSFRYAFFGGAMIVNKMHNMVKKGDLPSEAGILALKELDAEIQDFLNKNAGLAGHN